MGGLESLSWSRPRQAAEVFASLPDGLATQVSRHLRPQTAIWLSQKALIEATRDERLLRRTLRAFALELQARSGAQLPNLSRRCLFQLCRLHPRETADLLEQWQEQKRPPSESQPNRVNSKLLAGLARLDWSPSQTGLETVACILLLHLDPKVSAGLLKILGPDDVYQVTLLISQLPTLAPETSACVLGLFGSQLGDWERLARDNPAGAAACLEFLLRSSQLPPDWTKVKLSGASIAAILLDSLQPEWREDFVRGLDPKTANHLHAAAEYLCPAQESLVEGLTADFSRHFGSFEQLKEAPAQMQACLRRIAGKPQEQPLPRSAQEWTGMLVLYGDFLEDFLGDKPSRSALSLHRSQLRSAWGRVPLEYWYLRRDELDPFEVVLRYGGRELERFELRPGQCLVWRSGGPVWVKRDFLSLSRLEPEVRIESHVQVLMRRLWSAQAQLAGELTPCCVKECDLSRDILPALAVLRSFPANLLSHHLAELDPGHLGMISQSLSHLFSMAPDRLKDCLRDSCLLSPEELMQRAGLEPAEPFQASVRIWRVSVLLALAPGSAALARELFKRLQRQLALRITEAMMRLFYRWEERPLEPLESHPAVADFLSWRSQAVACPRNAGPAEMAEAIVGVWPFWEATEALRIFRQEVCRQPEQAAQELSRYLEEGPEVGPWVPGPVLAAQFLHSLNGIEELRRELCWRGYPVPCLPVDLALLERAQQQWSRREG